MDSFLNFLVRQKKFALVFSLAFIAIGTLSVVGMQRDQFPAVDFEILSVTTAYQINRRKLISLHSNYCERSYCDKSKRKN